jgi:glycine cleavage system H protein
MTVLLFISTIVVFLSIDYFVQRKKKTAQVLQTIRPQSLPFRAPAGIFFTKSHTWLSLFPSGKIQLGIDDFLARMFTTPTVVMLKNDGDRVVKGEPIVKLNEGANTLFVRSPIEGTVEAVNTQLVKNPKLMNDALFSEGWAYTMQPANASDLRAFFLGDNTRVWLKEETGRLRDFFAHLTAPVPAFMQDGGELMRGVLNNLNSEQCKKFENEFLRVE